MNKEVVCSICGKSNLNIESYYESGMGIIEEHFSCPICNYLYEYAYGQYHECFDEYEFAWSYLTEELQYKQIQNEIKRCKQIVKEKWGKKEG